MFELDDPFVAEKVAKMMRQNHFMHFIGFEVTKVAPGVVEGQLVLQNHHRQQNGYAHGGIMTTLCDTVAGFAAFTLIAPELHVVTAEIKVVYYRPAIADVLFAHGRVDKPGAKLHFCESEVFGWVNNQKKVFAKATATMIVV
ncbi:PaaI family thioesterase [Sphingobacteriales bacterium UPWRP_1]|nr:hypothetical protein BVG80_03870 [Sphingobacteriales bacterium TSM_CSM]PSJ75706.1 PaaI family thioesterase [Sphingobacteriales bacterium UPWRP_1]